MIVSSMSDGVRPARAIAAHAATAPSSGAPREASEPPNFPRGVRTAPATTISTPLVILLNPLSAGCSGHVSTVDHIQGCAPPLDALCCVLLRCDSSEKSPHTAPQSGVALPPGQSGKPKADISGRAGFRVGRLKHARAMACRSLEGRDPPDHDHRIHHRRNFLRPDLRHRMVRVRRRPGAAVLADRNDRSAMNTLLPEEPGSSDRARPLLIIVAYEAEPHLPELIGRLARVEGIKDRWSILLLDDASGDRTSDRARDLFAECGFSRWRVVRNDENQGYGGDPNVPAPVTLKPGP